MIIVASYIVSSVDLWDIFRNAFVESSVFPHVRVAKAKSLEELSSFSAWNVASVKIFACYKILRTCELYRLRFTYANRQLIPWRLSAASEKPEMRAAGWSLMKSRHREGSATAAAATTAATTAAGKGKRITEEGNEREGRGRRNEGSGRSIQAEEEEEYDDLWAEGRARGKGTTRKTGRLWEHQTASGEVAAAAGPLTVCVPEKVQCPPSKAGYIGIKRAMSTISRFVLGLSPSAPDAAKRKGRKRIFITCTAR